jgi:Uma2 family endonuclease
MSNSRLQPDTGPFRAEQLRDGDRYELTNGHPIYCAPAGRDHAGPNATGAALLDSDPDVQWTGVDAGYSPDPGTLRAPDVSVATPGGDGGWIPDAPLLAVEYAARGQNEAELRTKIADLLDHGTRLVWVVRLVGPRRVEVHAPGQPLQTRGIGELLVAPGILRNPVPVAALFDRDAAQDVILRNLLQRRGYAGLEAIREEGREEGRDEGLADAILTLLAARGLTIDDATRDRLRGTRDTGQLRAWLLAAAQAETVVGLFEPA